MVEARQVEPQERTHRDAWSSAIIEQIEEKFDTTFKQLTVIKETRVDLKKTVSERLMVVCSDL
jgi:hypothetical protein